LEPPAPRSAGGLRYLAPGWVRASPWVAPRPAANTENEPMTTQYTREQRKAIMSRLNLSRTLAERDELCEYCAYPFDGDDWVYEQADTDRIYCSLTCAVADANGHDN
jgi:hypothetical protein